MAFRRPEILINLADPSIRSRYVQAFPNYSVCTGAAAVSDAFEITRSLAVNPHNFRLVWGIREPLLNPDNNPQLFSFLQTQGDLMDGFNIAYIMNVGLGVLDAVQAKFTQKSFHPNFRLALSCTTTVGLVLAAELGLFSGTTPDISDIPAGLVGVSLFTGVSLLVRTNAEQLRGRFKFLDVSRKNIIDLFNPKRLTLLPTLS